MMYTYFSYLTNIRVLDDIYYECVFVDNHLQLRCVTIAMTLEITNNK